jgi:GntR family transcriptional regulator
VLSQALAERRIGVGGPLPSEPRLMRDYGVSRSTVRRALARLEAEGRILRRRGSGTYARDPVLTAPRKSVSPVLDGGPGHRAIATRVLAFERIPTPGFLCGEQPGFGGTTLLIRQIRTVEREPVVLETAYVREDIGGRLTPRRLGSDGGAILPVLAALGHRSASVEREFAAVAADPLAANSLGLQVGAPIFNVRAIARDSQNRMLAYINCCYRPDRYATRIAVALGADKPDRKVRRN